MNPDGEQASPARRHEGRIIAIDLLRGLIMVLMALDHTRDFFSASPINPLDLERTTPALFLTRWITHFCAPLFIFLSGVSSHLSLARSGDRAGQIRLLWQRGLLLILLELTWVHALGWNFGFNPARMVLGVLWAIGWSMIALALLIRYLPKGAGIVGLTMILGHNLLDGLAADHFGPMGWLWQILHAGGGFPITPGYQVRALYPLIPWIGVMALGFAVGPWFLQEAPRRRRRLLRWGWGLGIAFVLLRMGNLYGEPIPWTTQGSDLFTLLAFVKVTKYPPSLHYLLMTLGPGLLLLAWLDRSDSRRWLTSLNLFGQVPLFFYLLHLPLIHALAGLVERGQYGEGEAPPSDHGFGLAVVYLVTLLVLALLHPLCRRFSEVKRHNRSRWIRLL